MQWVKMWSIHRVKLGYTVDKNRHSFQGRWIWGGWSEWGEWEGWKWKKMGVIYNLIHR